MSPSTLGRRDRTSSTPTATASTPAPDTADNATLNRACRGDSDALADLWTIYQPQMLRLLRSQGRSTAEDISSQVWIDVARSIERFEGGGTEFRNWIFTIARRRAIDEGRRASRRKESRLDDRLDDRLDGRLDGRPASSAPLITPRLADRRSRDAFDGTLDGVLALLDTLQPMAAEVVMLRVVHDLPVAEVAAITGESEGNVRVMAHRALDRLRQTLADNGLASDAKSRDVSFA